MRIKFGGIFLKAIASGALLISQLTSIHAQAKLPSIDYMPQSPAAAAFSRYGEIPVNQSTGVPEISIPIYTLKVGDIEVPISISYHASGIKVRDVATEVGLGFVLNYGGVITANVIGKPDSDNLRPNDFKTSNDVLNLINTATTNGTTLNLAEGWRDRLELYGTDDFFSDRFYYSLSSGESGIFRKDFVNSTIRLLPYRPIKVDILNAVDINITASNGYLHRFQSISSDRDFYRLKEIVSANRTDSIQYYHTTRSIYQLDIRHNMEWQFEEVYVNEFCGLSTNPNYTYSNLFASNNYGMSNPTFEAPLVDSILSEREAILFEYATGRLDDNNHGYRLRRIKVKDKFSGQIIKSFELFHSYFGTANDDNLRLRLDSICVSGITTDVVETYSFNYNGMALPKYPTIQDQTFYEDYWGYYNGVVKSHLLPSFYSTWGIPGSYSYSDMNSYDSYNQACVLTQINYPTGGKTIFEYESNSVPGTSPLQLYGGLRIKKITSFKDASSQAFVKTYEYNSATAKTIEPVDFRYDQECWVIFQCRDEQQIPMGPPVAGSFTKHVGLSNSFRSIALNNGAPIIYNSVTEYFGTQATNTGRIIYAYQFEDWEQRNIMPGSIDTRFFNIYHSDVGNYVPQLTAKWISKYENGTFQLVRSESKNFATFKQTEFNTGINFASTVQIANWQCDRWQATLTYHQLYNYLNSIVYTDTKGYEEVVLPTSMTIRDYAPDLTYRETTTTYTYDNNYALLASETTNTSDGNNLTTQYKHPGDFSSLSPYNTMLTRNILNPVIEVSVSKNSTVLETIKTNYEFWSGTAWSGSATNQVVPRTVTAKIFANNPETRIRYYSYDNKGMVTGVSKEDDNRTVYMWDYNKAYPVVVVKNATENEVAFSSFETNNQGGWSGVNPSFIQSGTNSLTGKRYYNQSGFAISKSGLVAAKQYVVSYWSTSGAYSVTGTIGSVKQGSTVNINGTLWTYFEHRLSGVTATSVSGNGFIDELRLYPESALMITHTYEPLIGMTSQCDANSIVTYYEYDSFNRLKLIRDQENNILKRFDYQYKQTVQ